MMDKFKAYTDDELLELFQAENISAFDEVYNRYWKSLYSACYKRVQSRETAEEIVQDLFASLWINRNTIRVANLSAYLFAAIKYKVINHMAREVSRKRYVSDQANVITNDNSTEESVFLNDFHQALEREIEKLPAKRQMIFRLHKNEHLSMKQVASRMGISEKTVENQYGKALKVLKVNLKHFTLSVFLLAHDFLSEGF
ncbi:MAG: RNA polymerase sigma-70 factor [Chryseolinea sp.]